MEIDQIDYDCKYLNYNKIKVLYNVKDIKKNYRAGTIPYYFKIIDQTLESKQLGKKFEIFGNHEVQRKGTIPFYFAPKPKVNMLDKASTSKGEFFRS